MGGESKDAQSCVKFLGGAAKFEKEFGDDVDSDK